MRALAKSVLIVALLISATPAFADPAKKSGMVDTSNLPACQFYKDPLRLQILDNGPYVSDLRRPAPPPGAIFVPISPLPTQAGPVIPANAQSVGGGVYVVPTGGTPGMIASRPNPMLGHQNLPDANFQRYYKPSGPQAGLPVGTSTGVHSAMKPWAPSMVARPAQTISGRPSRNVKEWQPESIAHYDAPVQSVGVKASANTSTRLTGRLLDKVK